MESSTEKRKQPRLFGTFPVLLRSTGKSGERLKIYALADNVSEGGLYLQLPYILDSDIMFFALIGLPSGAKLATYGRVLRAEQKNNTLYGVALCFHRSRLFSGFFS